MFICICIHAYEFLSPSLYIYIYTHTHLHIHIYICMYAYYIKQVSSESSPKKQYKGDGSDLQKPPSNKATPMTVITLMLHRSGLPGSDLLGVRLSKGVSPLRDETLTRDLAKKCNVSVEKTGSTVSSYHRKSHVAAFSPKPWRAVV